MVCVVKPSGRHNDKRLNDKQKRPSNMQMIPPFISLKISIQTDISEFHAFLLSMTQHKIIILRHTVCEI